MVDALDSKKLAGKMQQECERLGMDVPVLLQVRTGGEDTKHGLEPAEALELAGYLLGECPRLRLRGLMAMGRLHDQEGFKVSGYVMKVCR